MGFFDFLKGSGEDVDESALEAAERENNDKMLRAKLMRHLRNKGLEDKIEGMALSVEGDKVTIGGKVKNDDIREIVVLSIGNFQGVAGVEDNMDVPAPAPVAKEAAPAMAAAPAAQAAPVKKAPAKAPSVFHTVESGDTLWAIAEKHLGDGNKYMAIFEANKPMLADPDAIYAGQKLRIPK